MASLPRTTNVIIALAIMTLLSAPAVLPLMGVVEAGPSGRTLMKDNWSVIGDETISNETIDMTGNLTIGPGAELTLDHVLLSIDLAIDRGFRISVHNGGSLILYDTTISSGTQGLRYDFTVMDGQFYSNGSNIYDFTGLSISGSQATLIKTNLMGNAETAILLDRSTMMMNECNVLVSGDGNGMEVVNSTAVLRSTLLKNLGAPGNIGINASGETDVTVDGGGIYDFSTGIYDRADWLHVKGAHISGSSVDGIFQIASYSDIRDSFFTDNKDGLHIIGGITNISGNDITAKERGIAIDGGRMTLEKNTVWSSGIGIEVDYTSANILRDNILRDNGIGLSLNDSIEEPIFGNTFEGNDIGLFALSSRTNITDCTFSSKKVDLDLVDSAITMLNSTYIKDSLDNTSALYVVWSLDVFVRNGTGKALANATVEILSSWVGWPNPMDAPWTTTHTTSRHRSGRTQERRGLSLIGP
jgi:parallel beta-helix repeat protein